MRRLACLLLLGAMHPALAVDPAPSPRTSAETAVPVPAVATPESEATVVAAAPEPVPQDTTPAAETAGAASTPTTAHAAPAAAGYVPKTPYDNSPYRFDMSQQGKRMSAADFDAWMKARGLRVATGKPAAVVTDAEPATQSAPPASSCQPAATPAC